MSTSTPPPPPPPAQDPNLKSQQPDPRVPPSSTADLPSDPLLKPGSFINANSPTPAPAPTPNPTTATNAASSTASTHTPNKASPNQATTNGSEPQSTPLKRRPATAAAPETLDWLPPGWLIKDRVRSSGATAGLVDRYYFDPASGRRFRSKKEVLYFLETGTPRKRKKGAENTDPDVESLWSRGNNKQKSGTKGKTAPVPAPAPMSTPAPAPTNFDYSNAPEKIQWVLTKTSEECWTPFIGKDKVPEDTKREWAVAFTFLTTSNSGNKM